MELWHGSEVVVEHPSLDKCRQFNDYGRGFYCTPHEEMAMEWACRIESDGSFIPNDLSENRTLDVSTWIR